MIGLKGNKDITVVTFVEGWADALKLITYLPDKYPEYKVDHVRVNHFSTTYGGEYTYEVDIKLISKKEVDL